MTDEIMEGQITLADLDMQFTKMSRELSVQTKARISEPCLKKPPKSQTKMPMFLDLRGAKWSPTGCILGNGWSIAWRLHDAQYWGVPQRRKRICLLADFNGDTAGKVLFELQRETTNRDTEQAIVDIGTESRSEVQSVGKGLSGNIAQSGKEGERVAEDTERCTNEAGGIYDVRISSDGTKNWRAHCYETDKSRALDTGGEDPDSNHGEIAVVAFEPGGASRVGGHAYEDVADTVRANAGDNQQAVVYGIGSYDSNAMKSDNPHSGIYEADTSRTLDLNGGNPGCNQGGMAVVCIEGNGQRESHKGDGYKESDTMYTLNTVEQHAVCIENHPADSRVKISEDGVVQTLSGRMGTGGGNVPMVMEPISFGNGQLHDAISPSVGVAKTLNCMDDPAKIVVDAVCIGNGQVAQTRISDKVGALNCMHDQQALMCESVVRRLTPMECERLQGFPDNWTNIGDWVDSKGKTHKGESDSPRYKALGNSIALPFWQWMAERMMPYLPENPTMASLFSGIGGFELVFSRAGCKPVWASEVEDFAIAVTKRRFPEE